MSDLHTRDSYLARIGVDVWYSRVRWPSAQVIPDGCLPKGKVDSGAQHSVGVPENAVASLVPENKARSDLKVVRADEESPQSSLEAPYDPALSAGESMIEIDWHIALCGGVFFISSVDTSYPVASQEQLFSNICVAWARQVRKDMQLMTRLVWPPLPVTLPHQSAHEFKGVVGELLSLHHIRHEPPDRIMSFGVKGVEQLKQVSRFLLTPDRFVGWRQVLEQARSLPSISDLLSQPELKALIWPVLLNHENSHAD